MERYRYIRVPKDAKAMEDYDYGVHQKGQLTELVLSEKQFFNLMSMGIFDSINQKCDIIIDDYEEEVLPFDQIPTALEEVCCFLAEHHDPELAALKEMLELALFNHTIVGFDF